MNDIESRLQRASIRPRRELRSDFTSTVLASLNGAERPSRRRPKWKEYIQVKLLHKPAAFAAAVLATITIGGTAYAAVGGIDGIRALFGGEQRMNDGSRVVQVDTKACPHVSAFNITDKNRSSNGTYYFRIKPNSKFTNTQVVHMVQGYCEADQEGVLNGNVAAPIDQRPENKDTLVGDYADSVITAITPASLTIHSIIPYGTNSGVETHPVTRTFTHIDPNVVVINKGATEPFSSLKVGDHISISYRATGNALLHSETQPPDQLNPDEATVVIITRVSQHASEYYNFQKYNSKDFEEVKPCKSTPSGYCTISEYMTQKK